MAALPKSDSVAEVVVGEGRVRLLLTGEVGIGTAPRLRRAALAAVGRGAEVEIDCGRATRLDGAALQVLLALRQEQADRGLGFRLIGADGPVREAAAAAGLTDAPAGR